MMLYAIVGPSGAGKTTLQKMMEDRGAKGIISTTSRPMRPGERDGVDYDFLSRDDFERKIDNDEFVEHTEYDGNYYGVSSDNIMRALESGKNHVAVIVVDIVGFLEIQRYTDDNGIAMRGIFLSADENILRERLQRRPGVTPEFIQNRMSTYEAESENAKFFNRPGDIVFINSTRDGMELQAAVLISNDWNRTFPGEGDHVPEDKGTKTKTHTPF